MFDDDEDWDPPTPEELCNVYDFLSDPVPDEGTDEFTDYLRKKDILLWYMMEYMCNTCPMWDKSVYAEKLHVEACTPKWQFKSKEVPKKAFGSRYCSTNCEALGIIMYENYYPFWVLGKGVGYKKKNLKPKGTSVSGRIMPKAREASGMKLVRRRRLRRQSRGSVSGI